MRGTPVHSNVVSLVVLQTVLFPFIKGVKQHKQLTLIALAHKRVVRENATKDFFKITSVIF